MWILCLKSFYHYFFSSWLYALNFGLNQLCKEIVSIVYQNLYFLLIY